MFAKAPHAFLLLAAAILPGITAGELINSFPQNLDLSSVEGLTKSAAYKVEVRQSGTTTYSECFVFETRNDWVLYDYFNNDRSKRGNVLRSSTQYGYGKADIETASFAQFSFAGAAVDVRVTLLKASATANKVTIRPLNRAIASTISPDKKSVTFSLPTPQKISVEINDRIHPIFIFSDAPDVPDTTANYYYGPGIHRIPGNGTLTLNSNQRVYIAAGAVVEGRFLLTQGSSGITIRGRGILSNGEWPHTTDISYSYLWPKATIRSGATHHFLLEGITLAQSGSWQVAIEDYTSNGTGTHDNQYLNVKTVSFAGNTDGFWVTGTNNRLDNCFIFNNDDAFVCKGGGNTTCSNTVIWGGVWGHLALLYPNSSNLPAIHDFTVQDVDIIGKEGQSELIYASLSGTNSFTNVTFRNIRVEERQRPGNTNTSGYNQVRFIRFSTANSDASISNLLFENVSLDQKLPDEGYLLGSSTRAYDTITFKNFTMGGELILSQAASNISVNQYVTNLRFLPPDGPVLTDLESWRMDNFGISANTGDAADGADPDGDGRLNLVEYATKNPPKGANTKADGRLGVSAAQRLSLTFVRRDPTTLVYKVEASDNLVDWTQVARLPIGTTTWTLATGATATGVTINGDRIITITDGEPMADHLPGRFLRLVLEP